MAKYLGASIVSIELDTCDEKVVHFYADSYEGDETGKPYRFVEYNFGYIPLNDILKKGMPDGDWYSELKQYIADCTETELDEFYEHYYNIKTPKIVENLTADMPCGYYIILAKR